MASISDLQVQFDSQNQFAVLRSTHEQISFSWEQNIDFGDLLGRKYRHIVISGLGGSAIGGDLLRNFLGDDLILPFEVNRSYAIPPYVNQETLFIASSYSGNTEETLEAVAAARKAHSAIVCITTGGKLKSFAEEYGLPVVPLMLGLQPRYGLATSFFAVLKVLQTLEIIPKQEGVAAALRDMFRQLADAFSTEGSVPFQLAKELHDSIPIIYSVVGVNDSVGMRLKCQFNENADMHAFQNVFSELNHNEIVGWERKEALPKNLKVIMIPDESMHPQIAKRVQVTSELIKKAGFPVLELKSNRPSIQERLLEQIFIGDWLTYYCALLNGTDPTEIDFIHHLKNAL